MEISLSEEQILLKNSVERFVERDYEFSLRRELAKSDEGFSKELWLKFSELGWLGLTMPEKYGGLDGSLVDSVVLMEALGRGLVLEPVLSSVLLGANLLKRVGSSFQQKNLIPKVIDGSLLLSFAFSERQSRYSLSNVEMTARRSENGYVLDGMKSLVLHGDTADKIIVSVRQEGDYSNKDGISLFIVDREAEGVIRRPYPTVDGLRAADIEFKGVSVTEKNLLGKEGKAYLVIEDVIDEACIAICGEAIGVMDAIMNSTLEYIKSREQFGVSIGSFQVLQHRAVDMFNALELSRAMVFRAADTVGSSDDRNNRAKAASAVKVQIGRAGKLIGQQAIQLHGGMGMTEEMSVSHYFKRLTMITALFGDADYHLKRYTSLGQ
ncbi:MAG: acyl-CoA dehydrogenase family protein [Alphaproteobacteria bacterium]|nr:acyl-CoA dehydrogenase family protein [Alphaproteobacteria bacterium]|tara:strand:- start:607 stop:1746 length:1140 start_codon:yes stop_codon:yes gene_type:complete